MKRTHKTENCAFGTYVRVYAQLLLCLNSNKFADFARFLLVILNDDLINYFLYLLVCERDFGLHLIELIVVVNRCLNSRLHTRCTRTIDSIYYYLYTCVLYFLVALSHRCCYYKCIYIVCDSLSYRSFFLFHSHSLGLSIELIPLSFCCCWFSVLLLSYRCYS